MKGIRLPGRPEALPWLLLLGVAAVLFSLIGASIAEFVTVANVHARTTLTVRYTTAFRGLSPSGNLSDNGSFSFTILFDVNDPTSRGLTFFTIGYKVWLEDFPQEAHLSGLSRTPPDIPVTNASGTFAFFPVADGSRQTDPFPVPASGNATLPFTWNLTRTSDPGRYAAIQNITAYAVHVLGGVSALVWNLWVLVNLNIDGIPAPASVSQADYFAQISRVQFIEGVDFGVVAVGHP